MSSAPQPHHLQGLEPHPASPCRREDGKAVVTQQLGPRDSQRKEGGGRLGQGATRLGPGRSQPSPQSHRPVAVPFAGPMGLLMPSPTRLGPGVCTACNGHSLKLIPHARDSAPALPWTPALTGAEAWLWSMSRPVAGGGGQGSSCWHSRLQEDWRHSAHAPASSSGPRAPPPAVLTARSPGLPERSKSLLSQSRGLHVACHLT